MFGTKFACKLLGFGAAFLMASSVAMADGDNVGSPAFKPVTSKTMTLKYGFSGASVYDNSLKKWVFQKLSATITRHKVEGYVNQVNDRMALAAGLHEIAVYDYNKHAWAVREKATPDDSTGELNNNFVLTNDYAEVVLLNGPKLRYTAGGGWAERPRR